MTITDDPLTGLEDMPAAPGAKTDDPDAPYGYTADGLPREKPGRKPGQQSGTGKASLKKTVKAVPAPPRKVSSGGPPKPPAKTQIDYRPALRKLAAEGIGSLAIAGLYRDNMLMVADAAAAARGAEGAIELANVLADKYTVVAAVLDKIVAIGPYAEGGGAVLLMVAQIAVNHRMMPPGLVPGTVGPQQLVNDFVAQQMRDNADFAAAVAMINESNNKPAENSA